MRSRLERTTTVRGTAWRWGAGLGLFIPAAALAIWLLPEPLVEWSVGRYPWATTGTAAELTPKEWSDAVTAARQGILLAAGGVLAAVTLFLSRIRDAVAADKNQLDRDANRTDRYTKAVEQLGSEQFTVRLGGIYALRRLGFDSHRDVPTIVSVISTWVLETAVDVPDFEDMRNSGYDPEELQGPTLDIVAAIQTISQLTLLSPDRTGLTLTGVVLTDVDFSGAELVGARFGWAMLDRSDFHSANLLSADFERASLHRVDFGAANLGSADLSSAYLSGANLVDAHLEKANLGGARFKNAVIVGANFSGARANGTDFRAVHGWKPEQFQSLFEWNEHTRWPEGYEAPAKTRNAPKVMGFSTSATL